MGKIAKNELRGLRLTSSRFSRNNDSLILFFLNHLRISIFSDEEKMRILTITGSIFPSNFSVKEFSNLLVRIDSKKNWRTNPCINLFIKESISNGVQQWPFVKCSEIEKISHFIKNWWVDYFCIIFINFKWLVLFIANVNWLKLVFISFFSNLFTRSP